MPIFKPHCSVYLAAFNVRTLKQSGQQASLARTLDSLGAEVCCVLETIIHDPTTVMELTTTSLSPRFLLRTSSDSEAAASGCAGVGIILSSKADDCLIDWIPVDNRLCAVRLATAV